MGVSHNFEELFVTSIKSLAKSLPDFKENALKIEFEHDKFQSVENVYEGKEPLLPFANSDVFQTSISHSRRMTSCAEGCKDVFEVTFDITGSKFTYKPGDTIGIIPRNAQAEVDFLLSHLELESQADLPYKLTVDRSLKGAKIPPHVPVKSTLRHVFTNCLDLRCVVKKLFLLALSRCTKDELERSVLEYLCSREGAVEYTTRILNKNICILDLFTIFKTCKPPVEVLLANLPRLLPRPYSIVNSQKKDPNVIKICFSVMETGYNRRGLVTGWLEKIISDSLLLKDAFEKLSINGDIRKTLVPIYLRKNMSGFALPENTVVPLLLIGPGTGVSPYIGFLEDREITKRNSPEIEMGQAWLFFGCRNSKLDFIYKEELNEFVKKGTLNKLRTAFSREENSQCNYIQDIMKQSGKEVTEFIEKGASIYSCGDLNSMAMQIKETLLQCFVTHNGLSKEEAQIYLANLQKEHRYFVDSWS